MHAVTARDQVRVVAQARVEHGVPVQIVDRVEVPKRERRARAMQMMSGGMEQQENDELMVDLAAVDGKIKASSIQKVNEIIDRYPNEAVSIIRSWMFQET